MLAAERATWSGTLLGVFVADEEIASEGAKFYAASAPKIDAAVVGEPTSNATFTAHKGSLRPVVRVHGVTAHSGTPHLGENAIYRAGELLDKSVVANVRRHTRLLDDPEHADLSPQVFQDPGIPGECPRERGRLAHAGDHAGQ